MLVFMLLQLEGSNWASTFALTYETCHEKL